MIEYYYEVFELFNNDREVYKITRDTKEEALEWIKTKGDKNSIFTITEVIIT